jgi:hypothetical protein
VLICLFLTVLVRPYIRTYREKDPCSMK